MKNFPTENDPIAILGLGYVGLPLIIEILKVSKERTVIGFDIDDKKINFLAGGNKLSEFGYDGSILDYVSTNNLILTSDQNHLTNCRTFIVTVPTPINEFNIPDLTALKSASSTIGNALKNSNLSPSDLTVAIFESTVFPGATEEVCYECIKKAAGTRINQLRLGYSPERINPGDNVNNITTIKKVTSGEDSDTATWVDNLYKKFVKAGTFKVNSIKTAEASKVIENTQRDLNIALANELAIICSRLNIDTNDVLDAACTKWNFMNIRPGLVGGHCIGVDPYYLAHKAESLGVHSKVILSGRQVNDGMPGWIARRALKNTVKICGAGHPIKCLIMGMTFKEDCDDLRNSKAIELFNCLRSYGVTAKITDPCLTNALEQQQLEKHIKENTIAIDNAFAQRFDLVILAVAHKEFKSLSIDQILSLGHENTLYYDLKNIFPRSIPNLQRL